MDILKARKKAKARKGKEPEVAEQETQTPEAAPAQAQPDSTQTETAPLTEQDGDAALLAEKLAAGVAPERSDEPTQVLNAEGEMVDIDEVIAELERDQAERRLSGGKQAEQLQESVADFLATFDTDGYDEEASYRHSFVRADEAEERRERYLNFRLASEEYGVALASVRETIKVPSVTKVPLNPDYVAGVISLRGAIIPVIDLRKRLGLPVGEIARAMRIIVVELEQRLVGLLVDEVRDVLDIDRDETEPPPATLGAGEQEFLAGIGHELVTGDEPGKVIILIRLESIARVERGAAT